MRYSSRNQPLSEHALANASALTRIFCRRLIADSARLIQAAGLLDSIVAYWAHAADFFNTFFLIADVAWCSS
jgi:hypothetical protein